MQAYTSVTVCNHLNVAPHKSSAFWPLPFCDFFCIFVRAANVCVRAASMDLEKEIFDDAEEALPDEFQGMTADDILRRNRLLDNEIRVLKDESQRLTLDQQSMKEKVKENKEKIKLNNQLPYLVGNIVEILEIKPEEEDEEDGANIDLDSQRKGKCVVLKTSTR